MSDDDFEAFWIEAGPPPEELDERGCLSALVLLASALGGIPLCALAAVWWVPSL